MPQPYNYNLPDPTAAITNAVQLGGAVQAMKAKDIAMQQQQQLQNDVAGLGDNPTPEAIANLAAKHPMLSEHFKTTYDLLNTEQQKARTQTASEAYAALENKNPQVAIDILNKQAEAAKNSGDEQQAHAAETMSKLIQLHPETAKTSIGVFLAHSMGPKNFANTFKALNEPPKGLMTEKDWFSAGYNPVTGKPLGTVEDVAKLISEYKMPPPSGRAAASKDARLLMSEVKRMNPKFESQEFFKRKKAVMDFGTGKQGNTVRSLNVGVQHLDLLDELAKGLSSNDTRLINKVKNAWRAQFGSPLSTNFDAAKTIVGDEIAKAVIGGPTAQQDREELSKVLDKAGSWSQIQGVVHTLEGLMHGQLVGLRQQYKSTTGHSEDEFNAALNPHTLKVLRKVEEGFHKGSVSDTNSVTIQGKTYKRPANFTDEQWAAYKKAQGVQ